MGIEGDSDSSSELDSNEDLVLTKIKSQVVANDARLHA